MTVPALLEALGEPAALLVGLHAWCVARPPPPQSTHQPLKILTPLSAPRVKRDVLVEWPDHCPPGTPNQQLISCVTSSPLSSLLSPLSSPLSSPKIIMPSLGVLYELM